MSTERPGRGQLKFQCDVCYDDHIFSEADGDDVKDFQSCWKVLRAEGWSLINNDHFCADCTKTAQSDRDNPFRR